MPNWRYIWYDIEERWDRLGLRKWINDNPKIIIGISIATGVLFLLIVITSLIPHNPPIISDSQKTWFYDLNTKKLFVVDGDSIPPIDAPSGQLADGQPAGVKAYVFSYLKDPKESERFIGYLEKFTPEGKKMISSIRKSESNVTSQMVHQLNSNRFVRRPADSDWVAADSDEGRFILGQVSRVNESGQAPHYCSPK